MIKARARVYNEAFIPLMSDMRFEYTGAATQGDTTYARWVVTGTQDGPLVFEQFKSLKPSVPPLLMQPRGRSISALGVADASDGFGLLLARGPFHVRDAREVALRPQQGSPVRAIESGAVDRAGEIGDEHPAAVGVQGQADSFHQVAEDDLGRRALVGWCFELGAADGVPARGISAVRPVEVAITRIKVQVVRLGPGLINQLHS